MDTEISIPEKRLLLKYLPQMETATKFGYYRAILSTDMKVLQEICRRRVDKSQPVRPWCGHCCLTALKSLYPLTKTLQG